MEHRRNTSEHLRSGEGVPLKPAEIRDKSGMEHREHLEHREKDRGDVVGAIGLNDPIGTRSHTHTMHSPLWGECRLRPQSDEPAQKFAIGYVAFEGDPDNLKLAIWRDGDWRDRQLRPLKGKVATWYKVTTPDGKSILS